MDYLITGRSQAVYFKETGIDTAISVCSDSWLEWIFGPVEPGVEDYQQLYWQKIEALDEYQWLVDEYTHDPYEREALEWIGGGVTRYENGHYENGAWVSAPATCIGDDAHDLDYWEDLPGHHDPENDDRNYDSDRAASERYEACLHHWQEVNGHWCHLAGGDADYFDDFDWSQVLQTHWLIYVAPNEDDMTIDVAAQKRKRLRGDWYKRLDRAAHHADRGHFKIQAQRYLARSA